jgi:hypothetical protein
MLANDGRQGGEGGVVLRIITNLSSWRRVSFDMPIVTHLLREFPVLFITAHASYRTWVPWTRSMFSCYISMLMSSSYHYFRKTISSPSYRCYMHRQSHPPSFDEHINIWRKIRVIKLLIIQLSPLWRYYVGRSTRIRLSIPSPITLFCLFSHEVPRNLHKYIPSDNTIINISRSKEIGFLEICPIMLVNGQFVCLLVN